MKRADSARRDRRRPRGRPVADAPTGPVRDLAVDAIAAGGDGVGRDAGLVVFVPRTAPGDVVRARWTSSGRFARGALVDIVRPSAERVEPPCRHYTGDRCGGCQLQHLSLPAQHAAKRRLVTDALARIGGRPADVDPVVVSPKAWRYRRKLTLALRRRAPGTWIAGLHPFDAPGDVFALADCPITDERVLDVWLAVMQASVLLPSNVPTLRAAVRLTGNGEHEHDGATLTVEGGRRWERSSEFFAAVPQLAGLWWQPEDGRRRLLHARDEVAAGASFAQVNAAMAERLRADVVDTVLAFRPDSLVDGYAGTGDVAVAVARTGIRATAIELDREAAALAAERLAPYAGRSVQGRVEDSLAATLPAAAIVVNPPRTGLDAAACDVLERAAAGAYGRAPDVLVYVSCNPATLARDLARLPAYAIRWVTPYDMFPQTAHVETLVVLEPARHDGTEATR